MNILSLQRLFFPLFLSHFSLYFYRKNAGSINNEDHNLSSINTAVSASNAKISEMNNSDTKAHPSSSLDLEKPSQNSSNENLVEEKTEMSRNEENSQSSDSGGRLNSVSNVSQM